MVAAGNVSCSRSSVNKDLKIEISMNLRRQLILVVAAFLNTPGNLNPGCHRLPGDRAFSEIWLEKSILETSDVLAIVHQGSEDASCLDISHHLETNHLIIHQVYSSQITVLPGLEHFVTCFQSSGHDGQVQVF